MSELGHEGAQIIDWKPMDTISPVDIDDLGVLYPQISKSGDYFRWGLETREGTRDTQLLATKSDGKVQVVLYPLLNAHILDQCREYNDEHEHIIARYLQAFANAGDEITYEIGGSNEPQSTFTMPEIPPEEI